MSTDSIVVAIGVVGMIVGLVVVVRTLRSGPFLPPYVPEQVCVDCGHHRSHHSRGGRCIYELGDPREGNDSYGSNLWRPHLPLCGCLAYRE